MPSDQGGGCSHPTAQRTPQLVQPVRAGRRALCRTPAEGPLPGGDLAPATHGPEPTSTETPEPAGNPVSAAQTPSQTLLFRRIPGIPGSPASGRLCLVRTWECSREAAPSGLRGASPHPPWQGSPPSSKSCPNQRPQTRGPKTTAIHPLIFRRSEARSRGVGPAGSLRRLENPRGAAPQLLGARASLLVATSPQSRPVVTVAPLLPTCPRGTLGTGSGPGFLADAERTLQGSAPPGLGRDGPEAGGGGHPGARLTFVSPQSLGHTAKRKKWAEVEAGREAGQAGAGAPRTGECGGVGDTAGVGRGPSVLPWSGIRICRSFRSFRDKSSPRRRDLRTRAWSCRQDPQRGPGTPTAPSPAHALTCLRSVAMAGLRQTPDAAARAGQRVGRWVLTRGPDRPHPPSAPSWKHCCHLPACNPPPACTADHSEPCVQSVAPPRLSQRQGLPPRGGRPRAPHPGRGSGQERAAGTPVASHGHGHGGAAGHGASGRRAVCRSPRKAPARRTQPGMPPAPGPGPQAGNSHSGAAPAVGTSPACGSAVKHHNPFLRKQPEQRA